MGSHVQHVPGTGTLDKCVAVSYLHVMDVHTYIHINTRFHTGFVEGVPSTVMTLPLETIPPTSPLTGMSTLYTSSTNLHRRG